MSTRFFVFLLLSAGLFFVTDVSELSAQREYQSPSNAAAMDRLRAEVLEQQRQEYIERRAPEWTIRNQLDPNNRSVRTRLGTMPLGRMPEQLPEEYPRFSGGLIFGRNDAFLGEDPNVPDSRFKEIPPASMPSTAQDGLVPGRRTVERSANTLAPTATPSPQIVVRRTPVAPRQPQPQSIDASPVPPLAEANFARTPAEQRWFRDIGRRPQPESSTSGTTGAADGMLGASRTTPIGIAPSAGPELLQNAKTSSERDQDRLRTQALEPTQDSRVVAADQAEQRRRFERQLEEMLLSQSAVHFLSPVQISFQGGIATIRGVVPTQQDKIAAGNMLFGNVAVKQVNNLISVMSDDPLRIPNPITPKN